MRPSIDDCLESWTKLTAGMDLHPRKATERVRLWKNLYKFIVVAVRINTCREVMEAVGGGYGGTGLSKLGLEITWS